ncbi:MAG: hypothetical protein R3E88_10075 [Myxococcota bacterium]|nr:hypothetical protein [Myxococcales bacterium]
MTHDVHRDGSSLALPSKLAAGASGLLGERYERPGFEVIPLDCEISSYAPDGDDRPLF